MITHIKRWDNHKTKIHTKLLQIGCIRRKRNVVKMCRGNMNIFLCSLSLSLLFLLLLQLTQKCHSAWYSIFKCAIKQQQKQYKKYGLCRFCAHLNMTMIHLSIPFKLAEPYSSNTGTITLDSRIKLNFQFVGAQIFFLHHFSIFLLHLSQLLRSLSFSLSLYLSVSVTPSLDSSNAR